MLKPNVLGTGNHCTSVIRNALMVLIFAATACAPPTGDLWQSSNIDLQWPPSPDPARIVWVKTINSDQESLVSNGFWQRALDFFIGSPPNRIVRPHGILFDAQERLFVADPGAGVVHCIDLGAERYSVIKPKSKASLITPIGLAIDDRENLYITDSTTSIVYRYDIVKQTIKPFLVDRLQRATGVTWNPFNRWLYVVDTLANQVVAFNEHGIEQLNIDGIGDGGTPFNYPTDIWVDEQNILYVTDSANAKIKIFTANGAFLGQFGIPGDAPGELNKPKGVATDSEGHIYVSDAMLDAVQIFDRKGQPLMVFGTTGTNNGEFWMPSGLYIDSNDQIFVADTYNRRVQVFSYLPASVPDNTRAK